jgi:hypothetical protein
MRSAWLRRERNPWTGTKSCTWLENGIKLQNQSPEKTVERLRKPVDGTKWRLECAAMVDRLSYCREEEQKPQQAEVVRLLQSGPDEGTLHG